MPPEAMYKFQQHRANAKQRGIEFDLTFDEWWAIWEPHFHNRGSASTQFNMCRTRDEGAYRTGNVRIDTARANHAEDQVTITRRATIAAEIPRETMYAARSWINRNSNGWGGDEFRKLEYRQENPEEFEDDLDG